MAPSKMGASQTRGLKHFVAECPETPSLRKRRLTVNWLWLTKELKNSLRHDIAEQSDGNIP